ncbi:MAG: hypothetical protein HY901_24300 [Deltaproteobacteria bacterium]|nr:hypothetical protein [Deltaproteobacteria bacterium]
MRALPMAMVLAATAALAAMPACWREPAGRTWDFDEEADQAEARDFLAKWSALEKRADPSSLLDRSRLALQALSTGLWRKVPGLNGPALQTQGLQDAERAAAAQPESPAPLRLIAAFQARAGNLAAARGAACRAADLAPRDADALESCGDLLRACGDGGEAVQRYRAAVLSSTSREQQFALLEQIERTSLTPLADLNTLPSELVAQWRLSQAAQASRGKGLFEHLGR